MKIRIVDALSSVQDSGLFQSVDLSKLFNIVLNQRFTSLDFADQHVVQMCPELTKFLPMGHFCSC